MLLFGTVISLCRHDLDHADGRTQASLDNLCRMALYLHALPEARAAGVLYRRHNKKGIVPLDLTGSTQEMNKMVKTGLTKAHRQDIH